MPYLRVIRPLYEDGRQYKFGEVFETTEERAKRLVEITPPLVEWFFPMDQPLPPILDPTAEAEAPKSADPLVNGDSSESHPRGDALSLEAFRGKRKKQL